MIVLTPRPEVTCNDGCCPSIRPSSGNCRRRTAQSPGSPREATATHLASARFAAAGVRSGAGETPGSPPSMRLVWGRRQACISETAHTVPDNKLQSPASASRTCYLDVPMPRLDGGPQLPPRPGWMTVRRVAVAFGVSLAELGDAVEASRRERSRCPRRIEKAGRARLGRSGPT